MIEFNREVISYRFVFFANVIFVSLHYKNYSQEKLLRKIFNKTSSNKFMLRWMRKNAKDFEISWNHGWINNMIIYEYE
jgi:hypothetical protein